jgi:hypothetical protein
MLLGVGLVTNTEMALLAEYGWATPFMMRGQEDRTLTWHKGQRYGQDEKLKP